jgi:hypothetical protein
MRSRHLFQSSKLLALLSLNLALLSLAYGCSPSTPALSDTATETPGAEIETATLPQDTPEPDPTPTLTATATQEPVTIASEVLSHFKTYDHFSGPFDSSKWDIVQPNENNPFTISATDGMLRIQTHGEQLGSAELYLNVPNGSFPEDFNGTSVILSPSTSPNESSTAGMQIGLTDGQSHWVHRCYSIYEAGRLFCEFENVNTGELVTSIDSIRLSRHLEIQLQFEWIPESGLLLTFLDHQLINSEQLDVNGTLQAESAGLFVQRGESNAGGDTLFKDFALGIYLENDLTLPDDLQPPIVQPHLFSKDGINYILYDDFENRTFDGTLDLRHWQPYFENDNRTPNETAPSYLGGRDGSLFISGQMTADLAIAEPDLDLRALQVDLLPQEDDRASGGIFFQLPVWRTPRASGGGDVLLSYYCNTNFESGPEEVMWCVYAQGNDQTLYQSFIIPIPEDELQQIRILYNEQLGAFQTFLNDQLVDQIEVLEEHQTQISQYGFEPSILVHQETEENLVFDNVVIGRRSETATTDLPEEMNEPDSRLPHSDLYLYDDFENLHADQAWDSSKWGGFISDEPTVIYQDDGALLITDQQPSGYASWMLYNRPFSTLLGQDPTAIMIEFQADTADKPYNRGFILTMFLWDDILGPDEEVIGAKIGPGAINCRVWYEENAMIMEYGACFEFAGCQLYDFETLFRQSANPDGMHSISMEHDAASNQFYITLDDEQMATYETPSGFDHPFIFALQTIDGESTRGTVRLENVWVGRPALQQ